jgi:hypothetical protein
MQLATSGRKYVKVFKSRYEEWTGDLHRGFSVAVVVKYTQKTLV